MGDILASIMITAKKANASTTLDEGSYLFLFSWLGICVILLYDAHTILSGDAICDRNLLIVAFTHASRMLEFLDWELRQIVLSR